MRKKIDLDTWVRKAQFEHFKNFDEPFYGVCVTIDCTCAYQSAKEQDVPFFLLYLYQSLQATLAVDGFRYRIQESDVYLYEDSRAAITVDRPDGTFGFGYIDYHPHFATFVAEGKKEIEKIRNEHTLVPSELGNVIHYSVAPWVNFTSLSHPRRFRIEDTCPKITFGKMTETNGIKSMPMAIHVHHALVDGRDIGTYIDTFQKLMNESMNQ